MLKTKTAVQILNKLYFKKKVTNLLYWAKRIVLILPQFHKHSLLFVLLLYYYFIIYFIIILYINLKQLNVLTYSMKLILFSHSKHYSIFCKCFASISDLKFKVNHPRVI